MSAAKNPHIRYRIIHSCLSNTRKRFWPPEDLIAEIGKKDLTISLRSLKSDLDDMRNDDRLPYLAPISYCRTNKGYYYSDPDYSIDKIPINDQDIRALKFATNILQQYMGVGIVNQFEGAIDKVVKVVNQLKIEVDENRDPIIAFERSPYNKGLDYFDCIHQAAFEKQPLQIQYRKFSDNKVDIHTFHPYFLKEYKSRWYILGYSQERHFSIVLGLERMEAVNPAAVRFKVNRTLKPETYFQHTLGITLGKGPVQKIQLWFSPLQAYYIKTRHLHHSQRIVSDGNEGLVITLELIPNYELLQEILSFGPEVKVLEPSNLQEQIKAMLKKGYALYD